MRAMWAITRRELISQYTTPLAWLILAVWTLATNLMFFFFAINLGPDEARSEPLYMVVLNMSSWVLIFLAPALTMNSFANERSQGTFQLLLTVPVADSWLILGKFFAAWGVFASLVITSLIHPLVISLISDLGGPLFLSGYSGLILLGAFFAALGIWISLLVESPVAAYVITFGIIGCLFLLGMAGENRVGEESLLDHLSAFMGWQTRLRHFLTGDLRLADIGWFLAMTTGFLTLAHGALGARRIYG